MRKFKEGQKAYIIESNLRVREVTLGECSGGFCVCFFGDCREGAIRVRESRLFETKEAAEKRLPSAPKAAGYRSPWDWQH